ncbi:MAG: hypothetical protein CMN79_03870 [Spirochaetales bacterium]|nr:hypothetical protein [Spirochaetales bacterium]
MIITVMCVHYILPDNLTDEISDFSESVRNHIALREKGQVRIEEETKFKALRVSHGLYEQREKDTYMLRIRCPGGLINPDQLIVVANLGLLYGSGDVHFTTRQEVQLHQINLKDIPEILSNLFNAGLTSRGGGGNTVRNILCPADSGLTTRDIFDVSPYAVGLTSKLISESESWNLPRKFKIAFSDDLSDIAYSKSTCLGFIASIKDGLEGFEVHCGGGLGRHPAIAKPLLDFIPKENLYYATKALLKVYDRHGNRKSKHSSRIKFLVSKIGIDELSTLFQEEYAELQKDKGLKIDTEESAFANKALSSDLKVEELDNVDINFDRFEKWKERFVTPQIQGGLAAVKIMIRSGDLETPDAVELSSFLKNFGSNNIRCDRDQNILLRNIPLKYLTNLFLIVSKFKNSMVDTPIFLGEMINCTGAQTCQLGICKPRGLVEAIHEELLSNKNLELDELKNFSINLSGCPNSCGMHHIADIGFFGKVGRKDSKIYPAYNVLLGAEMDKKEPQYAKLVSSLPANRIPDLLSIFLEDWLEHKKSKNLSYKEYLEARGTQFVQDLCSTFNDEMPSMEENINAYVDYTPPGHEKNTEPLSLKDIGQGECSAGVFDMIGVDKGLIEKNLKSLKNNGAAPNEERTIILKDTLLHSARMLLITKGISTTKEEKIFSSFKKHFIVGGLISDKYLVLMDEKVRGAQNNPQEIMDFEELIVGLASDVINIYDEMDDSLRSLKSNN